MKLHFDDKNTLGRCRLLDPKWLSFVFGTEHSVVLDCVAGAAYESVDMSDRGVAEWTVVIVPQFGSTKELWSTKTVTVSGSTISFTAKIETSSAYAFVEGRPWSDGVLCIKGLGTAGMESTLKVSIQLPVRIMANASAEPRYDAVEAIKAREQAGTYRDEAKAYSENADAKATAAAASASAAKTSELAAQAAQAAAETAQAAAEDAQEAAETAQDAAEDAQEGAETAEDNAKDSEIAAAASETTAGAKAQLASGSADASATSANQAEASRAAAAASAAAAAQSATTAVIAANKIPDPSVAAAGKVPTVNSQGVYELQYAPSGVWGGITGTLSNQTDLQSALDAKQSTISDLATIRSGAAAGATAIQTPASPVTGEFLKKTATGWETAEVAVDATRIVDGQCEITATGGITRMGAWTMSAFGRNQYATLGGTPAPFFDWHRQCWVLAPAGTFSVDYDDGEYSMTGANCAKVYALDSAAATELHFILDKDGVAGTVSIGTATGAAAAGESGIVAVVPDSNSTDYIPEDALLMMGADGKLAKAVESASAQEGQFVCKTADGWGVGSVAGLPAVTAADAGKILRVSSTGTWELVTP